MESSLPECNFLRCFPFGMVLCARIAYQGHPTRGKSVVAKPRESMDSGSHNFFDEVLIAVHAGRGGHGSAHFRREKYIPRGGPDGGDGGRGGDVILGTRTSLHALTHLQHKPRFVAADGQPGGRQQSTGRNGESVTIDVPCGTVVYEAEDGSLIADLVNEGDRSVVAHGGRGGLGNVHFKSARFQTPRISLRGEYGEERRLRLELELIADAGLIGAPNAGKSSLLSRLSAARPQVAPYPFTTLAPVLGVVAAPDSSFVLADLPGLIQGAGHGAGLGFQFLRHTRRARVLLHVVDGSGLEHDPIDIFDTVNEELVTFDSDLLNRPQIVVFNKTDLSEARDRWLDFRAAVLARGYEPLAVSAATNEGLADLAARTLNTLNEAAQPSRAVPVDPPTLRPVAVDESPRLYRRSDGAYVLHSARLERLSQSLNLDVPDAMDYFQRQLDRAGVTQRLERAGIGQGDTVVIGSVEFEWAERGL